MKKINIIRTKIKIFNPKQNKKKKKSDFEEPQLVLLQVFSKTLKISLYDIVIITHAR